MAGNELSPAKATLLAVQLVTKADIATLRTLVSRYPKILRNDIIFRIILTYLPESLDSSYYVPFIQDIVSGSIVDDSKLAADLSELDELSDSEANKRVKKLRLLQLRWNGALEDVPEEPLVLFLMQRALLVDENTGLVTQVPELIAPFLHHSSYLRTWLISTILPLLRLYYEYHPEESIVLTIPKFERLDDQAGVALLLSRTGRETGEEDDKTVGRDLRGLVGPWMYGNTRWKRRKLQKISYFEGQNIEPLGEGKVVNSKHAGWGEVFKWICNQATSSWKTTVGVIEQWDGPGDVDLGGYETSDVWLDEEDQQLLERQYAQAAIASAYLIPEESVEALMGVHRILSRITTLLDYDRIPTLQAAAALLSPVSGLDHTQLSSKNAIYVRKGFLEDQNVLTIPNQVSIIFLQALLISAYLCTRAGCHSTVKRAGELALLQNEREQTFEFSKLMLHVRNGPKGDDKYWVRMRNEILWLRSWGAEELEEGAVATHGRGIFGQVPERFLESEILKALLSNTRYTLAQSIYETSSERPLSVEAVQETVLAAAMNAYDNASNGNKTRGGVKKATEILRAFPATLDKSPDTEKFEHLINVTHAMSEYRLVFKQGEPFRPVMLRVNSDPLSIIGKILDQNDGSYTKINDFIAMGMDMVKAGLVAQEAAAENHKKSLLEEESIAEKRVVSMCIDAALAEDDFETAYSYVVTRLKDIGSRAHVRTPEKDSAITGLFAELPPRIIDDWSWKAALQAGKYRRNPSTTRPTHLGNSSGNLEIRHLGQRMDCLSQALRLAPRSTLQEILNVYRRCEEELESQIMQEAEREAAWDAQGDDQAMPGGFEELPGNGNTTSSTMFRAPEEAPMSLFDLSRASMARAQSGLSALSGLKGDKASETNVRLASSGSNRSSVTSMTDYGVYRERKRDQLKKAAVGTFAAGVGWVLGAPPAPRINNENENETDDGRYSMET